MTEQTTADGNRTKLGNNTSMAMAGMCVCSSSSRRVPSSQVSVVPTCPDLCRAMLIVCVVRCSQDEEGNPIAGPEFSAELAAELDQYGAAVGAPGQWASCVRLVDPAGGPDRWARLV
jgi:hypothetical protein